MAKDIEASFGVITSHNTCLKVLGQLRQQVSKVMQRRQADIKLECDIQIDETLWCHKVGEVFQEEQPDIYGRLLWVFGMREEE